MHLFPSELLLADYTPTVEIWVTLEACRSETISCWKSI